MTAESIGYVIVGIMVLWSAFILAPFICEATADSFKYFKRMFSRRTR